MKTSLMFSAVTQRAKEKKSQLETVICAAIFLQHVTTFCKICQRGSDIKRLGGHESETRASHTDGSAIGSNLGFSFVQGPSDVQLENLVIEPSDRWTACSLGAGCLAELLSETSSDS